MGTLQANEREGQAIDYLQDRMARKNNVVFFRVSEAEGSMREDKMADKAKIVSIASEVGGAIEGRGHIVLQTVRQDGTNKGG